MKETNKNYFGWHHPLTMSKGGLYFFLFVVFLILSTFIFISWLKG